MHHSIHQFLQQCSSSQAELFLLFPFSLLISSVCLLVFATFSSTFSTPVLFRYIHRHWYETQHRQILMCVGFLSLLKFLWVLGEFIPQVFVLPIHFVIRSPVATCPHQHHFPIHPPHLQQQPDSPPSWPHYLRPQHLTFRFLKAIFQSAPQLIHTRSRWLPL